MGVLDHTRTWQFETSMPPDGCVRMFADTLGGRIGTQLGSKWRVAVSGDDRARRAVATYAGRTSGGGRPQRPDQPTAIGSQLSFTATAGHDGTTSCAMAMTRTTKVYLFFTADARFFRSAMSRVATRLRDNDSGLDLIKR